MKYPSIDMILGFRINISLKADHPHELVSPPLMTILQLVLTGGVGGVFIVRYATKGIMIPGEESEVAKSRFASEYDELMWLSEKQKGSLSEAETLRFYELRDKWPEMHLDPP